MMFELSANLTVITYRVPFALKSHNFFFLIIVLEKGHADYFLRLQSPAVATSQCLLNCAELARMESASLGASFPPELRFSCGVLVGFLSTNRRDVFG